MHNGNRLDPLRLAFASGNLMHSVQDVCIVVPIATFVTNANDHILQPHKPQFLASENPPLLLVLE